MIFRGCEVVWVGSWLGHLHSVSSAAEEGNQPLQGWQGWSLVTGGIEIDEADEVLGVSRSGKVDIRT